MRNRKASPIGFEPFPKVNVMSSKPMDKDVDVERIPKTMVLMVAILQIPIKRSLIAPSKAK